jgi:hypothetical protein
MKSFCLRRLLELHMHSPYIRHGIVTRLFPCMHGSSLVCESVSDVATQAVPERGSLELLN